MNTWISYRSFLSMFLYYILKLRKCNLLDHVIKSLKISNSLILGDFSLWFVVFLACIVMFFPLPTCLCTVSGRSSAYGDTTVEGHPVGPGSVSSSTGAISTTTAQHEGEGSEGEAETEGDIHTSNRLVLWILAYVGCIVLFRVWSVTVWSNFEQPVSYLYQTESKFDQGEFMIHKAN